MELCTLLLPPTRNGSTGRVWVYGTPLLSHLQEWCPPGLGTEKHARIPGLPSIWSHSSLNSVSTWRWSKMIFGQCINCHCNCCLFAWLSHTVSALFKEGRKQARATICCRTNLIISQEYQGVWPTPRFTTNNWKGLWASYASQRNKSFCLRRATFWSNNNTLLGNLILYCKESKTNTLKRHCLAAIYSWTYPRADL